MRNSLDVSAPEHSPLIFDWTCYLWTSFCHGYISIRIFYRGSPGFATDCPWGIWCHGLTIFLLYIGTLFEQNDSGFVSLTTFLLLLIVSHLNAPQYDKTLFSFTLFSCLKIVLYFLHSSFFLLSHWIQDWYMGDCFPCPHSAFRGACWFDILYSICY